MKKVAVYLPGVELRGDTAETGYAITVLEGLVDSPAPRIDAEARDYGHGDFGQDLIWGASRQVTVAGTYFGDDQFGAGNVLKRLFGQHFEVVFELPSGSFRAEMYFSERVRWEPGGIDWADFELTLKADDPRLYGPRLSGSTGVPSSGAGLSDPVLDPLQVGELVEDARNLFVNPRLVGDGTWVEVARFVTGETPPVMVQPEDFRVRDLGTGESVMEIERVRGLQGNLAIPGLSSQDGKPAVRVIPQGSTSSGTPLVWFDVPAEARNGGTVVGKLHIQDELTGTFPVNTRRLGAYEPLQVSEVSPNVPGTYDHRLTYGALLSPYRAVFYAGARAGGGDVWWTDIGLFAGDYDGPVFTGGDPAADGYIYSWAGEPDNSPSIRSVIAPGAEGNLARVSFTNAGTAPTEPIITVRGGVSEGFELLHVEAGRVIRCVRPIPDGSFVRVDNSRGEVWIDDQSPLPSTYLPVAEWFQVGAGESCTIQWAPLGAVTGTPEMVVEFAEASW